MTNAERIQANNAELREAIELAESLPDAGGGDDTMVGTWIFNEVLDLTNVGFYFDFVLTNVADALPFYYIYSDNSSGGTLYCVDENEDYYTLYQNGVWVRPEYRTITITAEPTDAECIAWLKANARKATYEDGLAAGGGGDSMVDWWEFNEELDITLEGEYYVKIKKPDGYPKDFIGLTFFDGVVMGLLVDTNGNYTDYYEEGFQYGLSRVISIVEEPDDPELAEWIKANARKLTYDECYEEGEKAILSTYVDWSVSTTSNSCSVEFDNDCDYYAHIHLYVQRLSGDDYGEGIVLSPHEELTITNGEMGWQDLSGEEWTVQVTIEGFSKDGEM